MMGGAATTLERLRSSVGMAMIWTPMPPLGTSSAPGTAAPGGEAAAPAPGGPFSAPRTCPGEPGGHTVTVTGAAPLELRSVLPSWWNMGSWYVRVGSHCDGDGVVRHHSSIRGADCHGLEDGNGRRRLVLSLFKVLRSPHSEGPVQHSMSSARGRLSLCQHFRLGQRRPEMNTHLSERQLAQKEHHGTSTGSHFL